MAWSPPASPVEGPAYQAPAGGSPAAVVAAGVHHILVPADQRVAVTTLCPKAPALVEVVTAIRCILDPTSPGARTSSGAGQAHAGTLTASGAGDDARTSSGVSLSALVPYHGSSNEQQRPGDGAAARGEPGHWDGTPSQ